MTEHPAATAAGDTIWTAIRAEAWSEEEREPYLRKFLSESILKKRRLEEALSLLLARKLATEHIDLMITGALIDHAFATSPTIATAIREDLKAIRDRDPASKGFLAPFLYFKGFQALESYRVANWYWEQGRQLLALQLQNRISEIFGVDIHPAARISSGILIDHATGIVIGETAVIDHNVSILHGVTLGGTGKETGDRHPKVREGVLIGAGATILGNIEIGAGAKVAAGSVVLTAVPPGVTVAGVPARVVGRTTGEAPAFGMDQKFPLAHIEGSGI